MKAFKTGVLLINLGTPDNPTVPSIRKYLKAFLMDKHVVQLPWLLRALLVYGLILPFRPSKTVKAYEAIWTKQGSPLLALSQELKHALQESLGLHYQVELAMRYGSPNIETALDALEKTCDKIVIIPQFPQYAQSTTYTVYEEIVNHFSKKIKIPELRMIQDFYDMPAFIQAQANQLKQSLNKADFEPDYYLFSFHGLPENHVKKIDQGACDLNQPCPAIGFSNRYCYRAQCYETARLLAKELNLSDSSYQVSFQSRLGRTPWIRPYTDQVLTELRTKGVKNLAITCPAFTIDCLETLEEIQIRGREQWQELGGEGFVVAPCVNSDSVWVTGLKKLIQGKTE